MHTELHNEVDGPSRLDRRQVLRRAIVGGAAISVGSALIPVSSVLPAAWGQEPPTEDDITGFGQGLELAAVTLYQQAAERGLLSGQGSALVRSFSDHHRQHATAMGSLRSEDEQVTEPAEVLMDAYGPLLEEATDEAGLLGVLRQVENALAATYFAALESAEQRVAGALSTVIPVEAQHATVLGTVLGRPESETLPPYQTGDNAVSP